MVKKVSVSIPENLLADLKEEAGRIPLSAFLTDILLARYEEKTGHLSGSAGDSAE